MCNAYFQCSCEQFTAFASSVPQYATLQECVDALLPEVEAFFDAATSMGLSLNEPCLTEILAAYEAPDCKSDDLWEVGGSNLGVLTSCPLFVGTKDQGARCNLLGLGLDECAAGLYCDWLSGVCEVQALPTCRGAFDVSNCPYGEYCLEVDDGGTGTCGTLPGEGEPCAYIDAAKTSPACGFGLVCDAQTQTCVAGPKAGEPCADYGDFVYVCADGFVCDEADPNPMCQVGAGQGDPCANGECGYLTLECADDDTCQPEPPAVCYGNPFGG